MIKMVSLTGRSGKIRMNRQKLLDRILVAIMDKADERCTHDNSCSDPECCYPTEVSECDVCKAEIAMDEILPNGCIPRGHKFSSYGMCTICGEYRGREDNDD